MMWLRVVSLVLLAGVTAVKREDFKTCEQSGFCKRQRSVKDTGYEVLPETVRPAEDHLGAVLQNGNNKLAFRLWGLKLPFSAVDVKSDSVHVTTGDKKLKVVVTFKPFVVEIYNEKSELIAQVNRDGKLMVEEYRIQEEGKEYPENFWQETFKSHTDSKPFGSSSVGVDISFVGFRNAYGLPEHADSFSLKSTTGNTDPFRLYNLDVFEYELNNPMSLYVAVPYIVAHKKNATVGALWLNAAETWIDTSSSVSSKGFFRSVLDKVMPGEEVPHFDAHFMSETGLIDIFFFGGPSPLDVQRQLSRITGVNENFDVYDIPMDVMWLDIEHTDGKKYFTWEPHKFAHPKEMIDGLAAKGRKMVTIIDPHIKKDDNYPIYKDAKDLGLYVKKADGETDFEGHCWPGASAYLDFLNPETRKYWAAQFAFDRAHAHIDTKRREPWLFSKPTLDAIRQAIRRRYALLPYWYTLFREHYINGAPPMRPVWYEFPTEEKFFEEEKSTRWYEWESGMERPSGSSYVDAPITHIPVFQRGGTIIPTWQRIRRAASLMVQDPLTLFVALDRAGNAKGRVYLDDGATHDYKQGAFVSAEMAYNTTSTNEAEISGQPAPDGGKYETETWIERIEVRGLERTPKKVMIIRSSDPTVKLEFSYDRDRRLLTIRKPLVSINQSYKIIISF
ncbi:glycosyl hydrolase, family 31 [Teladorsagia circumcincta]|uniref:Glucosidase II subunit alpha n=1 Tax=Teladorsagia circumcincta TaxID=45464 RepID=A0A2G9U9P1_TELCI|nr:glycosyl hydrolase, family 31 [Teladorsagia circumcincta]